MNEKPKYMNQNVDYKKSLKPDNKRKNYVPEALALTGLGLYGIDAIRHGPGVANANVGAGFKTGIKAIKLPLKGGVGVAMNVLKRSVGKAAPKVKAFEDGFEAFRVMKMERAGVKLGDSVPKGAILRWRDEYRENIMKVNEMADASYDLFKQKHNLKKDFTKLTDAEKGKFKDFFKSEYTKDYKAKNNLGPFDKVKGNEEFGFDVTKVLPGGGKKGTPSGPNGNFSGNMVSGMAIGAAAGLGQLGVHALGEKYFAKEDDERVRGLIRKSYGTKSSDVNARAQGKPQGGYQNKPQGSYQNKPQGSYQNKPYNKPYNNQRSEFKKEAGLNAELMDEYLTQKAKISKRKDMIEAVGEAVVDPLIFTGIPLGVSGLLNRDIKAGFRKIDDPNAQNTDDIMIDVPIDSLKKKASLAHGMFGPESPGKLKIMLSDEHVKHFLTNRRKGLLKTLPWGITTGLIATKMDPYKKGNGSVGAASPIPEGSARITISTAQKRPQTDMSYIINKSAGAISQRDNDRTDDIDEFLKELRKSMASVTTQGGNVEKAVNYQPKDGIVGKQKSFNKIN